MLILSPVPLTVWNSVIPNASGIGEVEVPSEAAGIRFGPVVVGEKIACTEYIALAGEIRQIEGKVERVPHGDFCTFERQIFRVRSIFEIIAFKIHENLPAELVPAGDEEPDLTSGTEVKSPSRVEIPTGCELEYRDAYIGAKKSRCAGDRQGEGARK